MRRAESLFARLPHPFAWTVEAERKKVLENVEEPIWNRFLEEAEAHFDIQGGLPPPRFPIFCHNGDLDEVMSLAVLAYARPQSRYWSWIADWLRGMISYYRHSHPIWREHVNLILQGKAVPGAPQSNPRQFFDSYNQFGAYWVEGGIVSCVLHLHDLLESEAPEALSTEEKNILEEALASFAERYAFHEEAFKYSNRGLWANAGILISGITHADPEASRLLLHQAGQRYQQLRSTYFDDGMHGEGAADYHSMATDGLICYAITASRIHPETDPWSATAPQPDNPYLGYPAIESLVKAYATTVVPGEVLRRNPRGCSVYEPVPCGPALVAAAARSRDPELEWLLRSIQDSRVPGLLTPMRVTPAALLGLNQYMPLINFWLYRPIGTGRAPGPGLRVLKDHGAAYSRSGSEPDASFVWARFGYEGTGKGHRDGGHVAVVGDGRDILSDPFPRFGPPGLGTAPFHNVVVADRREPPATIGVLSSQIGQPGLDAFLLKNTGGSLPKRSYLHDPREESNYYFTKKPVTNPPFLFSRAVVHLHRRAVLFVDGVEGNGEQPGESLYDWFFHTPLLPEIFDSSATPEVEHYASTPADRLDAGKSVEIPVQGRPVSVRRGEWASFRLEGKSPALLRMIGLDADFSSQAGHHFFTEAREQNRLQAVVAEDYFLRFRTSARKARALWLFSWGETSPQIELEAASRNGSIALTLDRRWKIQVNFADNRLEVIPCRPDGP